MTQVLIDRATLELVLRTLNRLRYDNDSAMAEEGFHEAAEALRAALANAELTDEEILSLEKQTPAMNDAGEEWIYFARAVLKKAREE